MSKITTATCLPPFAKLQTPWQDVDSSFARLYLTAVVQFERPGSSDDADKAERLSRNLARRLDWEAPGVAASILEGSDEMLTVNWLGLPTRTSSLARLHQLD